MNFEREVKKILIKMGGPTKVTEWLNKPSCLFEDKTPKQCIVEGQGKLVLEKVNDLYMRKDSSLFLESEEIPP